MDRIGQSASCLLTAVVLAGGWGIAAAAGVSQDGIDRNLLERQQRERDFHVRLYDAPRDGVPAATITLPVPESFTKREAYDAPPPEVPGSPVSVQPRPEPAPTARQQLDDSQFRRQLELQTQTKSMDDVTRQQQSQIQQLQFGRENQAQQLQQQIQRDSNASMQRLR